VIIVSDSWGHLSRRVLRVAPEKFNLDKWLNWPSARFFRKISINFLIFFHVPDFYKIYRITPDFHKIWFDGHPIDGNRFGFLSWNFEDPNLPNLFLLKIAELKISLAIQKCPIKYNFYKRHQTFFLFLHKKRLKYETNFPEISLSI